MPSERRSLEHAERLQGSCHHPGRPSQALPFRYAFGARICRRSASLGQKTIEAASPYRGVTHRNSIGCQLLTSWTPLARVCARCNASRLAGRLIQASSGTGNRREMKGYSPSSSPGCSTMPIGVSPQRFLPMSIYLPRGEDASPSLGGDDIRFADFDLGGAAPQPHDQNVGRRANPFGLPEGAFPDDCHAPSLVQKCRPNGAVSSNICLELPPPELRPRRWCRGVAASVVSMPETAVDEQRGSVPGQNNVRPPLYLARVKPETKAASMKRPP